MLNDVLVVGLAIGLWLALGYPVARRLGSAVVWPALAAPPLGLAILGTLTTILYVWGLRLDLVFKICMGLAIPGMALAVHDGLRSRLNRSHGQFLLTFLVAMLLVLLPKWLGHPEFPAFQMNVADQIGYQSQAWMALHYDYPTIRNMDLETRLATGFGLNMPALITLRPAVTLMLGGFASVVDQPVMIVSYAYLAALQLCVFFTSLFVLRNVIELSNGFSLLIALGLTVGFFLQYALDVNAWSAFASLSLVTLYAGLLTLGLATPGPSETNQAFRGILSDAFFWSMLVCMTGFLYIYPEILSLAGAVSAGIALYLFFASENRTYFLRRSIPIVLAAGGTIALCAFEWSMTIGFFLKQARWLADATIADATAGWWKVTHRYLLEVDNDPNTAFDFAPRWHRSFFDFLHQVLSITASFLAGVLGVYFLQPGLISTGLRTAWNLGLLCALAGLLVFWLWSLLRASGEPRQRLHRALFAGVLGGLALTGGLLFVGQPWAAGKALIWVSPILVISLTGSLLSDKRTRYLVKAVVLCYVGLQIGFGGYRSYGAAHGAYGAHYPFPYPLDIGRKIFYSWDYAGLQAALKGCSRVSIDLDDPYHEHFVEMALSDMGLRWSSRQPVWPFDRRGRDGIQKQIENPDCVVTTEARSLEPNHAVVWLRRDDRVLRFYRGETNRLDLVPNVPMELDTEGLATNEPRIEAWSNGRAVIRVPNNPKAPSKRLILSVYLERLLADIRVAVVINGRPVLDEIASRSGDPTSWSRTVELPDFGQEAWLNMEVRSTYARPDDTRPLRVRLLALSLER